MYGPVGPARIRRRYDWFRAAYGVSLTQKDSVPRIYANSDFDKGDIRSGQLRKLEAARTRS